MSTIINEELKTGLANKGKIGLVSLDELTFGVVIKDARLRFGHVDYLIAPITGEGTKWVEQHRVNIK